MDITAPLKQVENNSPHLMTLIYEWLSLINPLTKPYTHLFFTLLFFNYISLMSGV